MADANQISGYDIRYTQLEDALLLRRALEIPGGLHYFPMSDGVELDNAIQCWIGFCRWFCSLTATIKGEPCGVATLFLMPYRKVAHHCLSKLIVAPEHRRKGIGTSLLRNLKHLAKHRFHLEMVDMEIFDDNPMEHLLRASDFHLLFRQEGYVQEAGKTFARLFFEAKL